jgi:hypothetical protein
MSLPLYSSILGFNGLPICYAPLWLSVHLEPARFRSFRLLYLFGPAAIGPSFFHSAYR